MTPQQLRVAADRLVAQAVAQGFPAQISDEVVVTKVVAILREHWREQAELQARAEQAS